MLKPIHHKRLRRYAPVIALMGSLALCGCESSKTDSDESSEPRRKKKKKRRKRQNRDAAGETTAPIAPPPAPLPPVSPTVRTAPPPDLNAPLNVDTTASGLTSRVLKRGHGTVHPGLSDRVDVHYSGWTIDGKMFDSSVTRGKPATFGVDKVIKGWSEGLQLMVEGERRRFWIPAELAYGNSPRSKSTPAGRLVFDVELLKIHAAPIAPPDLTLPQGKTTTTKSGLVYKVLRRGTSTDRPSPTSKVEVHYSGWTQDGKMFDSSITRGRPATFPVDKVIPGWTEGLQLMSPGDAFRFWIPAKLAYGDKPKRAGTPAGLLVFDVELISIR